MVRRDRLSRRELLSLSAGTLLSAGLWLGVLQAEGADAQGGSPGDPQSGR